MKTPNMKFDFTGVSVHCQLQVVAEQVSTGKESCQFSELEASGLILCNYTETFLRSTLSRMSQGYTQLPVQWILESLRAMSVRFVVPCSSTIACHGYQQMSAKHLLHILPTITVHVHLSWDIVLLVARLYSVELQNGC